MPYPPFGMENGNQAAPSTDPFAGISPECRAPIARYAGCVAGKGMDLAGAATTKPTSLFGHLPFIGGLFGGSSGGNVVNDVMVNCRNKEEPVSGEDGQMRMVKILSDQCLGEAILISADKLKKMATYAVNTGMHGLDQAAVMTNDMTNSVNGGLRVADNATGAFSVV